MCGMRVNPRPVKFNPPARAADGRVLLEALVVMGIGLLVALFANEVSPRGLKLTRNYFPTGTNAMVRNVIHPVAPATGSGTNSRNAAVPESLVAQLKTLGFQLANGEDAVKLFHDPRFARQLVVFIDARDGSEFEKRHIPGAYELDPYHPEQSLTSATRICQKAEEIVVYCNGGDCDDSVSAAILLRDVGINSAKLFIYAGGISDWIARGLPVESGGGAGGGALNNPK